jgi:hypothetical protein
MTFADTLKTERKRYAKLSKLRVLSHMRKSC